MPDHVAHRHAHPAALERDGVVPVPAHVGAAGLVAGADLDPLDLGQPLREQAALEHLHVRDLALVRPRVLDGEPGAVGHQDQQALVLEGEGPRRAHGHLDHPGQPPLDHERRGHQRTHARRGHHRVEPGARGQLLERHGPARRHHVGEHVADLDRHAGLRGIEPLRGADRVDLLLVAVLEQDAHDVGAEHLGRRSTSTSSSSRSSRCSSAASVTCWSFPIVVATASASARRSLGLGAALLGHVHELPDVALRPVVAVRGERHAHDRVHRVPVRAHEALLRLVEERPVAQQAPHGVALVLRDRGVGELPERLLQHLRLGAAEQLAEGVVHLEPAAVDGAEAHSDRRALERRPEALLGGAQLGVLLLSSSSMATFERSTSASTGLRM